MVLGVLAMTIDFTELCILSFAYTPMPKADLAYTVLSTLRTTLKDEHVLDAIIDKLTKLNYLAREDHKYVLTRQGTKVIKDNFDRFNEVLNQIKTNVYNNL